MRFLRSNQLWLGTSSEESHREKNPQIRELLEISKILDECPGMEEVYSRVLLNLVGKKRTDSGKTGLTAEQALRAALVKEKLDVGYRDLEFHLRDSLSLREFVRLEPMKFPKKSVLNRDIRLISEETWELFNECTKKYAKSKGMELGKRVRSDTTVTETNIHHPTDSQLLCDCVRVLTRLMSQASGRLPGLQLEYSDHNRRAKSRLYNINNTKKSAVRREQYRDLIKVTEHTRDYAMKAYGELQKYEAPDVLSGALCDSFTADIKRYWELTEQVIDQSIRRVLNGEEVPVEDKVVSIFEPHTDIIQKGGRETLFGHKVCLTSGRSGLILDCMILEGNPADSSLVATLIGRHENSYGAVPEQMAFDGGFASVNNRDKAKELGVTDIVFSKTKGMETETLARSTRVFKLLSKFRAGIEAGISALKRSYGFGRVLAKGWRAFKNSLLNGVAAFNLTLIARYQLARA